MEDLQPLRVDRGKILDYLLAREHPDGASKAAFFESMGFRRDEWQRLAEALRQHGRDNPVGKRVASKHGVRYIVDGPLNTPTGRRPIVRSVWIAEPAVKGARLVTAHPA